MTEPALSNANPAPEEDVTTTLYRAAIGPVSGSYYLPIFTRFEAADHAGISWNTAASLLTLNWLVFRKLWVAALAYVGILVAVALLVFGVGHLVLQFSDTLMMVLGLGFGLVAFVLPGLFGNALFHTECRKAMSKALVGHANVADARDALLRQASTRRRAIWLAAANAAFLLIAVLVYLQVAALSTVSVLPHGAVEAGQVSVVRAADMMPAASAATTITGASTAIEPASAPASAALATASAATVATSAATPAASEPKPGAVLAAAASAPPSAATQTPASSPMAIASAPTVSPAAPPMPTPAATQPVPTKSAANASKAQPAPSATVAKPVVTAPVQAKPKKESDKAKKLKTALAQPKPDQAASEVADSAASRPFFINVGLFSIPENAERAHAKLLEAQLPSVMKELKSKTRQIRVRVGPFASQASAELAVEKIKGLQLEAVIIQP